MMQPFNFCKLYSIIILRSCSFKLCRVFLLTECFVLDEKQGLRARNEEFSKIAFIKNVYSSQIKNTVICGGFCMENVEINHANQQFNTYLLTCKQTTKIIRMRIMLAC